MHLDAVFQLSAVQGIMLCEECTSTASDIQDKGQEEKI